MTTTTQAASDTGARVHWLLVGGLSAAPTGARRAVTAATLPAVMAATNPSLEVVVPDRLGGGEQRTLRVAFGKPRAFQLAELILAIEPLRALRELADALGSRDASVRPSAEDTLARARAICGEGRLSAALAGALGVAPAPSAPAAPAEAHGDGLVDEILSRGAASVAPARAAGSAVAAFVKAGRGDAQAPLPSGAGRAAREAIEAAVFATASDVLREPTVARIEAAWRGVKLVLDQCTGDAGMAVELLDLDAHAEGLLDALAPPAGTDAIDQPDAIFLLDPVDDLRRFAALAEFGLEQNTPVVVAAPPGLFGQTDAAKVPFGIEQPDGGLPAGWKQLRHEESARWLCVAFNRVAVAVDGAGPFQRVAFVSAAAAVAAFLAASYRATGAFGQIVGPTGALRSGATWELTTGPQAGTAVPTEALVSARAQASLAGLGVLGVGSGRNTDALTLNSAPTAYGGVDVVSLPAQVLTGRVVRFALWVRDQVPPGTSDAEVTQLFEQAAGVFLFPGMAGGLQAKAMSDKSGARSVLITATVSAQFAGAPFHLAFPLAVPA